MHKNTKLLPYQRREAFRRWRNGDQVTELAKYYRVSRKTLYEVFHKAKLGVFENYSSKNMRFRTIEYGLKKLEKTEKKLEKILAKRARRLNRYVKKCPGEMVHTDSSVLPLISESRAKNWIDDARRLMKFCERARYEFENGSQDRRRQIVAAIGTEHILKD